MALRDTLLPIIRTAWAIHPMDSYDVGVPYPGHELTLSRTGGASGVTWSLYEGSRLLAGPVIATSPESVADLLGRAESAIGAMAADVATGVVRAGVSTGVKVAIGGVVVLGAIGLIWWASK